MDRIKLRLSQTLSMTNLVSTLVVAGVMLIVGAVVFAKVKAAMPSLASADANSTIDSVETTTYDAFELATVALIVLAAAVIISILLGAFGAG